MLNQETMRLINGQHVDSKKIIARCHLLTHPGYLTKNLVKSHDCVAKKCSFFKKMNPKYWEAVEATVQTKKLNQLKRKQELEVKNNRDEFIKKTLESSGHIYVTCIKEEPPNLLVIYYIYDKRMNLEPEIQLLRRRFGKPVKLQARIGSDSIIELLIRKPRREAGKVTDLLKAPKVGIVTKKRLQVLGIYCLEDLFGRSGDELYYLDCRLSNEKVDRRYLNAYNSAVEFASALDLLC